MRKRRMRIRKKKRGEKRRGELTGDMEVTSRQTTVNLCCEEIFMHIRLVKRSLKLIVNIKEYASPLSWCTMGLGTAVRDGGGA